MRKFAVIDIGSNSVRLMFMADGKVLYKGLITTRLGEGIATTSLLNAAAIERSARAVETFYNKAVEEGAEEIFAFATAAVRSAKNGYEFTDRVFELCGAKVEVISGEEEAEIGIVGALGEADGGLIDIGGASTEIVIKSQGEMLYKKSVNIGVVRLLDMCGRDKVLLRDACKKAAKEFGQIPHAGVLTAIGGTATTLAAQILGLEQYQSEKVTGAAITLSRMQEMSDKLALMSVEEIAALPCMPKGRAEVITGGAVLFATLMETLGIEKLIVSDKDNLEGFAIKRGLMG